MPICSGLTLDRKNLVAIFSTLAASVLDNITLIYEKLAHVKTHVLCNMYTCTATEKKNCKTQTYSNKKFQNLIFPLVQMLYRRTWVCLLEAKECQVLFLCGLLQM